MRLLELKLKHISFKMEIYRSKTCSSNVNNTKIIATPAQVFACNISANYYIIKLTFSFDLMMFLLYMHCFNGFFYAQYVLFSLVLLTQTILCVLLLVLMTHAIEDLPANPEEAQTFQFPGGISDPSDGLPDGDHLDNESPGPLSSEKTEEKLVTVIKKVLYTVFSVWK